ncbi:MAG: DDE-type integrase/transposase/recombinase, partial [bacterium]|nr:DDE-type integrase/transposase/recombinase [bacterium]
MRSTSRITNVARNTVAKLLEDAGTACMDYQDEHLVNLPCRRLQCDEIWSFCYAKEKNVPDEHKAKFGYGDVWVWVAMDADTKLVPCWTVGERNTATARAFMQGLAARLRHRVQLTTDGYNSYLTAVEDAFGMEIDYAMLVKQYGPAEGKTQTERKYSPGEVNGVKKYRVQGNPKARDVSTSY